MTRSYDYSLISAAVASTHSMRAIALEWLPWISSAALKPIPMGRSVRDPWRGMTLDGRRWAVQVDLINRAYAALPVLAQRAVRQLVAAPSAEHGVLVEVLGLEPVTDLVALVDRLLASDSPLVPIWIDDHETDAEMSYEAAVAALRADLGTDLVGLEFPGADLEAQLTVHELYGYAESDAERLEAALLMSRWIGADLGLRNLEGKGDLLRMEIELIGIKDTDAADILGITPRHLSRILGGQGQVTRDLAVRWRTRIGELRKAALVAGAH